MDNTLASFTDVLDEEIYCDSQPLSLPSSNESNGKSSAVNKATIEKIQSKCRPTKGTGRRGHFRSTEEIDPKYRNVFTYPYFNLVQSRVIEDALYSDKSIVVCAPTGSGKTVIFEMAIVQLLMELEDKNYTDDFKIICMAPVKALCTERLTEWYPKFTKLGLMCIEVTGDTDVDFIQLKPYKIIITTPEKWDMLTRRWRDHSSLVEVVKLFLIDEVHILNDETRGPVLEAVVSRMKTIESSAQSVHRIEQLQNQLQGSEMTHKTSPSIRFVAVSATVSNPEDVATWLGTDNKPAVFHKFGDECRPVKLKRIVEGYPCPEGSSIFKFDIILNYKLWPVIQKYHSGKPTLIFCNTRKSVILTAETLSRELTINFNAEQKAKLTALASTIKNKKLQLLVMSGVGCHHAGLLYEERQNIELAFRNRDLPILITTTTLAMGVNLPAHLVIIKNTQQYVNGAYQEYSISTVLQMVGRAGRPQFDTEATAVIMTRLADKARYQALVGGCEPLQSFLHKRLPENLNSEAALRTVGDVAQCVQWLRSTFLYVRAAKDPKKYLNLPINSPQHHISKKIEELCVKAMNGLASAGLITMDEACCIESTEAGRLMSIFYLDLETMKQLMKIEGTETLERLLVIICECHELADMHLRVDERRCLNALNRSNTNATIRFPMKGKISTRQMKLNCIIQAVLGCLVIPDPSLNQEAMKIIRIADRVCKCLVAYVTRPDLISRQPQFFSAVLNSIILAKCIAAHLWENSPYVSKQLKGIGPTFSTLLTTAGKVNFMLLEESHPRDLERIMNKGAPAGNVLRKQISLLPKYQLTMIPVDENTVTVQLVLLNQNFLSENIDQLTAGVTHKSYIIVGDSNNHVLLLVSFKDKDLIRVFDGTITHEVRRKHSYEHKIFAHCVSSTFVGIDVQAEYVFNDLNPFFGKSSTNYDKNETPVKDTAVKQTCITDTFKAKKRKGTDLDKTQSKEKKKRDNVIIENFKYLKKTFETATKNVKENLNLSAVAQNIPNNKIDIVPENEMVSRNKINEELPKIDDINSTEDVDSDDFIDNEKIDSILTEIENEMSKKQVNSTNINTSNFIKNQQIDKSRGLLATLQTKASNKISKPSIINYYDRHNVKRKNKSLSKSNYNFIELLERNLDVSDEEDNTVASKENNGFSETIKNQINKYLQKTETKTKTPNTNVELLLDENKSIKDKVVVDSDGEENLAPTQKLYPKYEIKEILGGQNNAGMKNNVIDSTDLKDTEYIIDNSKNDEEQTLRDVDTGTNATIEMNYDSIQSNIPLHNLHNPPSHNVEDNFIIDEVKFHDLCISKKTQKQDQLLIDDDNDKHKSNESITGKSDAMVKANSPCNYFQKYLHIGSNNCDETVKNIQNDLSPVKENFGDLVKYKETNLKTLIPRDLDIIPVRVTDFTRFNSTENLASLNRISSPICGNTQSLVPFGNKDKYKIDAPRCTSSFEHNVLSNNDNLKLNENTDLFAKIPILSIGTDCTVSNLEKSKKNNKSLEIYNDDRFEYGSNNYSEDQTRTTTDYIKNYSYSATKIGVCTKETPEYSVRVIKKMKMDLNVTEIISTMKPRQNDSSQSVRSAKSQNIKDIECSVLAEPILDNVPLKHTDVGQLKLDSMHYEDKTINNYLIEDATNNKPQRVINHHLENKIDNESNTKGSTKNIIQNCEDTGKHMKSTFEDRNVSKGNKQAFENVTNNFIEECNNFDTQDKNGLDNSVDNENNKVVIEAEVYNNMDLKPESNKLQNILQKYSKILGKETAKSQTTISSVTTKNFAHKESPRQKSKKPFKISDIQKLKATLPDTIIDYNKTTEQNIPSFATIRDTEQIIDKHEIQTEHYNTPFFNINPIDREGSFKPHTDVNIEPIDIPNIDLEPDTDFKMDQSLFDPKALLQCTVNSECEEIIPPPPQFCDYDTAHSHKYDDIEDSNKNSTFDDSQFDCSSILQEDYLNYNKNIFDDQCITNLTPSHEIETWTLAEDKPWENMHPSQSPAKSFTVIRTNTPKPFNLSGASVKSRQTNLGQFKFNHKNKLRKWK